ncbi:MAG: peptidylprolyl isomerase [Verrucomicrobiales bacterium]|nr:peptidylprolyl isomerase [Verrucomicrobiales bacterium]
MNRLLPTLLLAAGLATPWCSAQSLDAVAADPAAAVEAARVMAPEAVEKAEKKVDEVRQQTSGSTRSRTSNPDNPAGWGPEDMHKLAVMEVNFGGATETIMFELFPSDAPKTVANFIQNADSGVYKGLAVHRAIDSYLVQTGDPLTADEDARDRWGTGGADNLAAEIKRSHKLGAVAMARRGDAVNPDKLSNDSQFYFVLGNMANLDGQYTVFGQVVSGLDVLESMSRVPADSNDCPLERIEVKSLRVVDHKGPLVVTRSTRGDRRYTKPLSAKGPFERLLERIW